ncbi:MAG TPA: superoxide dismutase family protein [Sphingobium sp.]|nr:superoxide dismutase family protein [Sphingobium sp.]
MPPMPRLAAPLLALTGLSLALGACASKAPPGAPPPATPYAEAILYDTNGQQSGRVTLIPNGDALAGSVQVTHGLTPGAHGAHIHAIGQCTLKDFASAGGHLNPGGKQHGLENPLGAHEGDLPMLVANAAGAASMTFTVPGNLATVLDADGGSFVIHADPDDMKSDPAGNSGARIMCGVFYKKMG